MNKSLFYYYEMSFGAVVEPHNMVIHSISWEFFTFSEIDGKSVNVQLAMLEMNVIGRKK